MQNLESVAQKIADLTLDTPEPPHLLTPLTNFFSHNLFGQSIQTSTQNLESVAQEMSELCSILRFGGHFVFGGHLGFGICLDCPYELPCKIWTL